MKPRHYRDLITRASKAGDMHRIDQLAAQLAQAEEAHRLLQALTHCFGLNTRCVWRAQFDAIFDQAVYRLYEILKGRVAC
ncbi:hypothetical protein [Janthinobacterium sp. CG_23.4]|uniref:hypothetical protein n=1 Tax=Janthinobacterium sp. CG_23.4 TaxID=2760707 RepID=UPI00247659BA|nr:hypothetical protein [Janthinobacterium sp. CG_23.4]MDH6157419.1 hypothetical protein [Janthinobacterium sp. CG_23.4]